MSDGLDHTPFFGWEMHQMGNEVQIKGVIIGDANRVVSMYLTGDMPKGEPVLGTNVIQFFNEGVSPTPQQFRDWINAADDPKYLDEITKVIVRKVTRHVDQELMWATYRRDNFTCQYCGATDRAMTYDHWEPQSKGGPTTLENGVTACRACNKKKGHMPVEQWKQYMVEKGFKGAKALA